jgi:2,3-bisphosphoglycerate-independent phosphoglycerate mutase
LPAIAPAVFATLTEYDESYGLPVVFASERVEQSFGQVVERAGLRQLRIAETEKYAHVTYFFSGGREQPFEGEDRILIPSPRDVPTYDRKPEMSALGVTDALLEALEQNDYAFVLVNYANADMVGHTGVLEAAVRAVEVVDACLDRLSSVVLARGGQLLITADHGNIERMIDPQSGGPHTAHTTNPVPLYWVTRELGARALHSGGLADIAPTLCALLDLEPPTEMGGRSLIARA